MTEDIESAQDVVKDTEEKSVQKSMLELVIREEQITFYLNSTELRYSINHLQSIAVLPIWT